MFIWVERKETCDDAGKKKVQDGYDDEVSLKTGNSEKGFNILHCYYYTRFITRDFNLFSFELPN